MKKYGSILLVIVVVAFAVLETLPQKHVNPPVIQEPSWDRPETRLLAKRACFDCHSNETRWPPYANHTPVAWLIQRDVKQGRHALNFSEWDRPQGEAQNVGRVVMNGEMPPKFYVLMHPEARLTPSERAALVSGLHQARVAVTGTQTRPGFADKP